MYFFVYKLKLYIKILRIKDYATQFNYYNNQITLTVYDEKTNLVGIIHCDDPVCVERAKYPSIGCCA